jgi:lipopolysaccharide biosynthesis glycosyltransferase
MAAMFPTVSFAWLRTDAVDYGNVRGKIPWATIVTMDRTILPELVTDVDRIIHLDLDALCLADLAELFDTDLEGTWIAAADEPQPRFAGGFNSLRDSARLLRREGFPELAREYLIRTHAELTFDFEIFNAGVMLLDLATMRAENFCGRYLGYVERFGINGQRVLNIGVGADRKKLSADWNRLISFEVTDSPKVTHWAGPMKPWGGHPYVAGRELWRNQEEQFAARTERLQPVEAPTG